MDRECDAPPSPNSLKYSLLSQNQVLLIMPHGQLATAVESQVECTVVGLLAAVVSIKYLRVCDMGGVKVQSQLRLTAISAVEVLPKFVPLTARRACHNWYFVSKEGKCEESGEMQCYRATSVVPLSIMAVRLPRAETVSF